MFEIKIDVINAIIEASKNTFPNEFIGMLGGNPSKKTIDELVVVPAEYGNTFSVIQTHLVPFDPKIIGTIHSHPAGSNYPSAHDLNAFARLGQIHLIIAKPFNTHSISSFDSTGKRVRLKITQ